MKRYKITMVSGLTFLIENGTEMNRLLKDIKNKPMVYITKDIAIKSEHVESVKYLG